MRKFYLLTTFAACILLSGCQKWPAFPHSTELTWTDCASTKAVDTKGPSDNVTTWLTLEYTEDGLAVTLTDAEMNCAISMDGLQESIDREGNVIKYRIIESFNANCNCLIERISSTITGLETGKEYVLKFSYGMRSLKPVTFKYKKGFIKHIDVEKNIDDSNKIVTAS